MSVLHAQTPGNPSEPECIARFKEYFSQIDTASVYMLNSVYANDVVFKDPLHHINGLDSLKSYFEKLNGNLNSGSFAFHSTDIAGNKAWLEWTMTLMLKRPRKTIVVEGISILTFEDRIVRHHDYFDAGALIYEHIPVLGGLIRKVKQKFAR